MKIQFKSILFLLFIHLCSVQLVYSQKVYTLKDADKLLKGATKIIINEKRNTPSFVILDKGFVLNETDHVKWLKTEVCKLDQNYDFKLLKVNVDSKTGMKHYNYREYYKGYLLEDGGYKVHTKGSTVISANGECYKNITLKNVAIDSATALKYAINFFGGGDAVINETHEAKKLTIMFVNNVSILCYKFILTSQDPLKKLSIYVDANNGEIVTSRTHLYEDQPATAHTVYNGIQTITTSNVPNSVLSENNGSGKNIHTWNMNNGTNYNNATDFHNTSTNWSTPDVGLDVHYALERTYDYFNTVHSWNSFNGAATPTTAAPINAYVHFGNNTFNAQWDHIDQVFWFGDGNGLPLTTLDIVAHEYTHAITSNSSNLVYQDESGALNESFSDIMGVAVDFFVNGSRANYQLGEQLGSDGPLRDMAHPENFGMPRCYMRSNWYNGSADFGGVHTNSSVQNLWFYLLVNGGAMNGCNNDPCNTTLAGVGMDQASEVAFNTLVNYMYSTDGYLEARENSIAAATDITGDPCSKLVREVTNAWFAVGVGDPFIGTPQVTTVSGNGTGNCIGTSASIKLSATGCGDLKWYDTPTGGIVLGEGETFYTPRISASKTYYVEAVIGCNKTARVPVDAIVNVQSNIPKVTISASQRTICKGGSVTLTAGNANSYSWIPDADYTNNTLATQTVSPLVNTTYNVVGSTSAGCLTQEKVDITVLDFTVNPVTICIGQTAALTITGSNNYNYSWSTGQTGNTINVSPWSNTTYTVTAAYGSICTQKLEVPVTVIASINVTVNSEVICEGETATLLARGADTYVWSPGGSTQPFIVVSPVVTSTYTVVGTDRCASGQAVATVKVIPTAHVVVSPSAVTICEGDSQPPVTLSGADIYEWKQLPSGSPIPPVKIEELLPGVYNYEICGKNIATSTGNLICNGDFSQGPDCFTTAYTPYDKTVAVRQMGEYWVGPSFFDNWLINDPADPMQDHTINSTDNMMLSIDGTRASGSIVWQTKYPIYVDQDCGSYAFSFWATTSNISVPDFEVYFKVGSGPWNLVASEKGKAWNINDGNFAWKYTGDVGTAVRWAEYCKYIWPNTGNTVEIKIVDKAVGTALVPSQEPSIHDYMIDDISFTCGTVCEGDCKNLKITVKDAPTINLAVSNNAICPGQSAILTASSDVTPTTYLWTPGSATTSSITVSPTSTQAYKVEGTIPTGCKGAVNKAVEVIQKPVGISVCVESVVAETLYYQCSGVITNTVVCNGSKVILEATTQQSYLWSTGATTQRIEVFPTSNSTYTVTSTSCGWTATTATFSVTVNPVPVVTPIVNRTICSGASINVGLTTTPNVASTFLWNAVKNDDVAGESVFPPYPNPSTITNTLSHILKTPQLVKYNVTPVSNQGCRGTQTTFSVTVMPIPALTSPLAKLICNNTSVNLGLTADVSPVNFWWQATDNTSVTGESTTIKISNTISDKLTSTSNNFQTVTYKVNPVTTSGSCYGAYSDVIITVVPPLNITNPAHTICSGSAIPQLLVNNPVNIPSRFTWVVTANANVGGETNNSTPASNITNILTNTTTVDQIVSYTVTPISNTGNCSGTPQVVKITLKPLPVVTVSPSVTICYNTPTTLTASGATSYSWSPTTGLNTAAGASVTAKPSSTTSYTVTGLKNTCSSKATVNVTVKSAVFIWGGDQTICLGNKATFVAFSVGPSYTYAPTAGLTPVTGGVNGNQYFDANPTTTTTYTITSSISNGCINKGTAKITVIPGAVVTVTPNKTVCSGTSTVLTASGASTYTWTPTTGLSASTGVSVTANPTITTTYTVTGKTTNGCQNTATVKVTRPTITVNSPTVCAGVAATLTASGGSSYRWNTGATTSSISVNGCATASYTVTGTANGCSSTAIATVTRNTINFASSSFITTSIVADNFTAPNTPAEVNVTVNNTSTTLANSADVTVSVLLPANVSYNTTLSTGLPAPTIVGQLVKWIIPRGSLAASGSKLITFNINQIGACENFKMDFESMSTSTAPAASEFTSDRPFAANCNGSYSNINYRIMNANTCFITPSWSGDPNSTWFTSMQDQTTGTGKWFYAYSPADANNYNMIWKKTVAVIPNTLYKFSYWLFLGGQQGVWWNGASQLQFNNEPIVYSNVTTNAQWTKVTYDWNTGSNTSAIIKINYVTNPGSGPNDWETFQGLDGIEFRQECCPTITVETSIESSGACTVNATCGTKVITSTASADICLFGGGKSLVETITDNGALPVVKTSTTEGNTANITIYPNPFTGNTTIAYQIDKSSFVNLEVFDVLGQKLETLVNTNNQPAGQYQFIYTPKGNASGIYYVKITIDGMITVRRVVGMN